MTSAFDSDGNDDLEIFECINAPTHKTFLVRMKLFDKPIELEAPLGGSTTINIGGTEIQIDNLELKERADLVSSDEPIKLPFSGFGDDLDGFKFKTEDIKSKLYVGDSEIVTAITIELTMGDNSPNKMKVLQKSSLQSDAHTLQALPANDGGIENVFPTNLLNSDKDVEINYKVYIDKGTKIKNDWLDKEHPFKAELVIWIPMTLEAVKDNAEIKFPHFEGIGSFFTSISESGFIESLNLAVGMNANPFTEGTLVIRDINTNYEIPNPMSANALNFSLSQKDVKYINENYFDPEFSIRFRKGAEIKIPKVFRVTTVSMTAKLNYTLELGDN